MPTSGARMLVREAYKTDLFQSRGRARGGPQDARPTALGTDTPRPATADAHTTTPGTRHTRDATPSSTAAARAKRRAHVAVLSHYLVQTTAISHPISRGWSGWKDLEGSTHSPLSSARERRETESGESGESGESAAIAGRGHAYASPSLFCRRSLLLALGGRRLGSGLGGRLGQLAGRVCFLQAR